MGPPPASLDGAEIVLFTPIDHRHRPTGRCRHLVAGDLQGPAEALAICRYPGDDGCYLFGCDASWGVVTDTFHATVDEAMQQAEFEYEGVAATWRRPSPPRA